VPPATKVTEIERIRAEYDARARTIPADRYAWHREPNLFSQAAVARVCTRLLQNAGMFPISQTSIADIGCGNGQWLLEFLQWGSRAVNLHGIDLLEERIAYSRERLPGVDLRCGDAQDLPWRDGSFDLVTQFTVFSSILDIDVQGQIAREMLRVLRPGGRILWYDCRRSNPARATVRGLNRSAISALFPSCSFTFIDTTLAPPVSRAIASRSWALASALESLPFACTHLAALITPEQ
jgi:ubiquinone/menaquinone biosynthesis C-methylase UbiE